jgi:4-diphosphocytidyl-2-C-methyl-D-erythritol kinase
VKLLISSPAKINPYLSVVSRRDDGLHEVSMSMLALDLCDEIEVELADGVRDVQIDLSGPAMTADVPCDERNLAYRGALVALERAREIGLDRDFGIRLRIHKSIPSQAGLGGGSSNAAAAAIATARLLGVDPSDEEFLQCVSALGADVAFFARARATGWARCRGAGERVTSLSLPRTQRVFVVLTPRIRCATAAVYAALEPDERLADPRAEPLDLWYSASLADARASLFNGLEAAAFRSHPALRNFRERLSECGGGHFRLAGSGSSFFGLFSDLETAEGFLRGEGLLELAESFGLRSAFVARPYAEPAPEAARLSA